MSNQFLRDAISSIIQPDRLAPHDAEDKKRHKHRRHHSSDQERDRGYRSDDGGRRRDEKSRDGRRERSRDERLGDGERISHARQYGEHRFDEVDNRVGDKHRDRSKSKRRGEDEGKSEAFRRAMKEPPLPPSLPHAQARLDEQDMSHSRPYGENCFDDSDDRERRRYRRKSSHLSKSRSREEDDKLSAAPKRRPSVGVPSSPPLLHPPAEFNAGSGTLPYGEHRFDDSDDEGRPGHRRKSSHRSHSRHRYKEDTVEHRAGPLSPREREPLTLVTPAPSGRSRHHSEKQRYGDHRYDGYSPPLPPPARFKSTDGDRYPMRHLESSSRRHRRRRSVEHKSDDSDHERGSRRQYDSPSYDQAYGDHRLDDYDSARDIQRRNSRHAVPLDESHLGTKSAVLLDDNHLRAKSDPRAYGDHHIEDYNGPPQIDFDPGRYPSAPVPPQPPTSQMHKELVDERGAPLTRPFMLGEHLLDIVPFGANSTDQRKDVGRSTKQEVPNLDPKPSVAVTAHSEAFAKEDQHASRRPPDPRLDMRNVPPPPMYPSQPQSAADTRGATDTTLSSPPPRLSVSRYPSELSPGDSRSEAGGYVERPRSTSSATSTTRLSTSTLIAGSGTLGPRVYQYQPLKEMEFRLVKILPERMSKLKCEIQHQSLDDHPEYVAISYAWGDGVDTRSLLLEGTLVPVAVNLYDALIAVRRKREATFIWVDALSIDQQNRDERSSQVRLMGYIYSRAMHVAIWLGPEADESALAIQLLGQVAQNAVSPQRIRAVRQYPDSAALFALLKRDYWKRLWVVQEVLLAAQKVVYCGDSILPWETYKQASETLWDKNSDPHTRQGPSSFPERTLLAQLGDESLLEVMRTCRKKLSENPRDKVFGVLGLLPTTMQSEFPVDYNQSVKTVYTDVVDYLISSTERIDVIREAIHFPLHANSLGLPSWCPDWSHIPEVSGLGPAHGFEASRGKYGPTKARYRFHNERRKLKISAIRLDAVKATGVAVGTFCASQDYLTAFLHWRAVLLHQLNIEDGNESHPMHKAFCRTLCFGQIPKDHSAPQTWHDLTYHVFSSLLREKMPRLPIDEDLAHYAGITGLIEPDARRKFLQDHYGNRMMGRSLCITEQGLVGMGSGYMTAGDVVVVPFGCSTPILLRAEGRRDEYRYIGDVYVDGYMHGEAVREWEGASDGTGEGKRLVGEYMLC